MKKLFLSAGLVVLSLSGYSQEIVKYVDEMKDRVIFSDKTGMVCYSETEKKGFNMAAGFKMNSSEPIFSGLMFTIIGLGCLENVELIILFEDGSKLTKVSWNKFNCDDNAWFALLPRDIAMLSEKRISKIRVTNGFKYTTFTTEVAVPDYFITIAQKAANNEYTTISE